MEYIENKEEEREQTRAIFKDMLKYAPSKIIGTIGNTIIIPIYTSLLPPAQYGLYSISIALLSFLCIIFSDWVGLSGLRFFRKAQLENDLSKYLSVVVSILGVNLVLMYLFAYIFHDNILSFFKISPKYFLAVLLLIIPVAVRALLQQLLRAQIQPTAYTCATIFNQFATIGLSIFFIKYFHLGAIAMLLAMGVAISLTDIIMMLQCKIIQYFKKPNLSWNIVFPIILYGIPLAATSLSGWVINQSNKVIMNTIEGFTEVAYVGVAYGATMSILMTVFSIITIATIPRVYRMYEAKIDVRPIISRFAGYFLQIAVPVVTIMALYSTEIIRVLAAPKFINASILVPYFAFGTLFLCLTDYTTLQYHLANKTWIEFIIKLVSGLSTVALTILLIPKFGLAGVGMATLASNFLYFLLSAVIRLPNLGIMVPSRQLFCIFGAIIPLILTYRFWHVHGVSLPSSLQMAILFGIFVVTYVIIHKFTKPDRVED